MKTKINFTLCVTALLLILSINASAQAHPCFNNTNCDVEIGYEMWDLNGCNVCKTGTLKIPANSFVNLPLCANFSEVCIWITDIGGTTPPSNHSNVGAACHSMVPFGQSGTSGCTPSGTWTTTHLPFSWAIN